MDKIEIRKKLCSDFYRECKSTITCNTETRNLTDEAINLVIWEYENYKKLSDEFENTEQLKCSECRCYYPYSEMIVTGSEDICIHCDKKLDEDATYDFGV